MTGDSREIQILQQIRDILTDPGLTYAEQATARIYTEIVQPLLDPEQARCPECTAGMADVTSLRKPPHSEHAHRDTRDWRNLPPPAPCGWCGHDRLVHQGPCRAFACQAHCGQWVNPDDMEPPRAWTTGDREPPDDVSVLYDTGTNPRNPYPYLCRRPYASSADAGWGWRVRPDYKADGPGVSISWPAALSVASGPLIEHHTTNGSTS